MSDEPKNEQAEIKNENAKQQIILETITFHEALKRTINERRLEFCPAAIVSALSMLLTDFLAGLSPEEHASAERICSELYPKLRFKVVTTSYDDTPQ